YLLLMLLALPTTLLGQSDSGREESDATSREVIEKARRVGMEVARSLQDVTIRVLTEDAQQLAVLSEKQARKMAMQIQEKHLPVIAEQAVLAAEEFSKIDWQHLSEQMGTLSRFAFQKEKRIEKRYSVDASVALRIDNRYGKVAVHNWDRKELKITIRVRTAEDAERKAQEALDRVRIEESKAAGRISLRTEINSVKSNNWWTLFSDGDQNRALSIDYEVYMPRKNELDLVNRYGPIELDDRDGRVQVSVSYGSLTTGRLNARGNSLSIAYSEGQVGYLNEGNVSVRYGGFRLGEAESLELALSYTSDSKIRQFNRKADISLKYSGGFEIGLASTIKQANIAANYSGVKLTPAPSASFNFNVAVNYGGFDYNDQYAY